MVEIMTFKTSLADQMRPKSLNEMVGQKDLLGKGKPLRRLHGQHFSYDKKTTKHYDYLAAYSDSMAGSDTDAALYYLAVLLKNGDLPSVVRRLLISG